MRLEYAFTDDSHVYLVTDYKPHGNLLNYLKKHKASVDLHQVKRIVSQLVVCLYYLHEEQHVLYRALQLENILVDELFNMCLCDFGSSKQLKSKKQVNSSFVLDLREENSSPE